MKKTLVFLIIVILTCSMFISCGKNDTSKNKNVEEIIRPSSRDIGKIQKTNKEIIANGKTSYKILISEDASSEIIFASNELKSLLFEATGVELSLVNNIENGSKYFSLGDTELVTKNNLTCQYEEVGTDGFKIKTVDDNIIIYSFQDVGVTYGVYTYLERMLNYDFYYENIYDIDRVNKLYLYDFDVVDKPDINTRVLSYGFQKTTNQTKKRYRMIGYSEMFPSVNGGGCWHNCFSYLSPDELSGEHPEWFNANQTQLCYTAHGDEESLALMIDSVANTVFNNLKDNNLNEIVFACLDNDSCCDCDACERDKSEYGAYSSSLIKFCNKVCEKVEQKFKEVNDKRADSFLLVFYAYHYLQEAPVKIIDNNGNITFEYADNMKCNKHLAPLYACSPMDYTQSIYSTDNRQYFETLMKWNAIAGNLHFWTYDQYFSDGGYMIMYDTFGSMNDLYKAAKEYNIKWIFPEAGIQNRTGTCFDALKGYLESKLGWDVNADTTAYTDKFFKAMYGSQSEVVKQMFNEIRVVSYNQRHVYNVSTHMGGRGFFKDERYWPKNLVKKWYNNLVIAEQVLLQEGNTEQAKNVRLEMISPLYILIRMYDYSFMEDDLKELKYQIKNLLNEFAFSIMYQGQSVSEYLDSLGI